MPEPNVKEGKLSFRYNEETFETYYKIVGELSPSSRAPLVVVHGAAGTSHDYMIPLCDLAESQYERPVVFYDQIGSSRSTHLPDKPATFWTFDLFVAELHNLVRQLGIEDAHHVLGHSWGGQIAAEYILRLHPKGLKSVILSNTLTSFKAFHESTMRMSKAMGDEVWLPVQRYESDKNAEDPEYMKALKTFYEAHACRVNPFPQEILYSLSQKKPDGAKVWAAIKDTFYDTWCINDRIHLMDAPALLINGEFDYMSDDVCGPFFWGMRQVKWVKFAQSSHMPFWEERERYMDVINSFLLDWD